MKINVMQKIEGAGNQPGVLDLNNPLPSQRLRLLRSGQIDHLFTHDGVYLGWMTIGQVDYQGWGTDHEVAKFSSAPSFFVATSDTNMMFDPNKNIENS